jgi:hypothetical protein
MCAFALYLPSLLIASLSSQRIYEFAHLLFSCLLIPRFLSSLEEQQAETVIKANRFA